VKTRVRRKRRQRVEKASLQAEGLLYCTALEVERHYAECKRFSACARPVTLVSMGAPERVETQRLILRRPLASDAEAIFSRYASDPEVTRLVGWPMHRSLDDTRAFLAADREQWERRSVGAYLIESRETGALLGSTGLYRDDSGAAMTGYVLARDAWGHGYATEALGAMVLTARGLGLPRLYAYCHPENAASIHVLEKCGFIREDALVRDQQFPNLSPGARGDSFRYNRAIPATLP
jgi:RimJ/RimL family protein N-acetyltransferase